MWTKEPKHSQEGGATLYCYYISMRGYVWEIGADEPVAMRESDTSTKARQMSRPSIAEKQRMRFYTAASGD